MRLLVARAAWWLSEVLLDAGYRIAYGTSYRTYVLVQRYGRQR